MFTGWRIDDENNSTTLPDVTPTQIQGDTVIEDTGGFVKNEVAGNYVKVPEAGAGVYLVSAALYLSNFATEAYVQVQLSRGGTSFLIGKAYVKSATAVEVGAVLAPVQLRLLAGDELRVFGYQNSGGPLTSNWNGALVTSFTGLYIGS